MLKKEKIVIVDSGSDFTAKLQKAFDHLKIRKSLHVFSTTPEAVSYILKDWKSIFCLISEAAGPDPEGLGKYATSLILTGGDHTPKIYANAKEARKDGQANPQGFEYALIERFPAASEDIFKHVLDYWKSTSEENQAREIAA